MSGVAIGLDLGGHGVRGVVLDAEANILADERVWIDEEGDRGIDEVEDLIAHVVDVLRTSTDASTPIGIGVPGFHDHTAGILRNSPNFPGWEDLPVAARLTERLGAPVTVENDANCALLGEALAGAARGCADVILLTLGTGVGSAFLVNGTLLRGARGAGAEAGHVALYPGGRKCGCGKKGCLEMYAGSTGLVVTAGDAWSEEGGEGPCPATEAIDVFSAEADAGGPQPGLWASRAIERYCLDLATGLAALVNIFAPEAIVLGGGISGALARIGPPIETELKRRSIGACLGDALPIRAAELGDLAGAVGAASWSLKSRLRSGR
ncbi:MAG: ROK family protein [Proteobacteria bacterium]|nr:ROK family protein [Pseudomonadota bacterium]